jgi:hypothetical protein
MYIKLNNLLEFTKLLELLHANKFILNGNLRFDDIKFVPEFVFIVKDKSPLTSKTKMVIWDGAAETVGSNYWTVEKDFDKIQNLATSME